MGNRWTIAIVALAVVCGATAAAPPITKTEARSLPPDVVTRRVLQQFSDVLIPPEPWPKGHKPKHPLSDMYYDTRPRGTYVPGLCETDQVIFRLHPMGLRGEGAETPSKVVGIEVNRRFRFLTAPSVAIDRVQLSRADQLALDSRCGSLTLDENFFWADDEEIARDGTLLLQSLQQVARTSGAAALHCTGVDVVECGTMLLSMPADKLRYVRHCIGDPQRNEWCTSIWGGDVGLTVYSDSRGRNAKILRVNLSELVTVADPRED